MKKEYIKPCVEEISLNSYDIMEGFTIPISGGTTPEESDAKRNFLNEEDYSWETLPTYSPWED